MDGQGEGRWAIVMTKGGPPVFWSHERASLEEACRVIRRRCPAAEVVWVDQQSGTHRDPKDVHKTR